MKNYTMPTYVRTNANILKTMSINKENTHEHKPVVRTTSHAKSWTKTCKVLCNILPWNQHKV